MNAQSHILPISEEVLDLTSDDKFAEGGNRFCYRHPHREDLCVKITRPGRPDAIREKKSGLKRLRPLAAFDDNKVEFKAYQQSAIVKPRIDKVYLWQHLPKCYGWQRTSLGLGLVTDLYADTKGEPAKTLEHYLQNKGLDGFSKQILWEFEAYLLDARILTKNILPHNLVIAGDGRLKLIDGLGRLGYLPFVEYFGFAREAYVRRRVRKMWLRAEWEASDKASTWTEVENRGRVEV